MDKRYWCQSVARLDKIINTTSSLTISWPKSLPIKCMPNSNDTFAAIPDTQTSRYSGPVWRDKSHWCQNWSSRDSHELSLPPSSWNSCHREPAMLFSTHSYLRRFFGCTLNPKKNSTFKNWTESWSKNSRWWKITKRKKQGYKNEFEDRTPQSLTNEYSSWIIFFVYGHVWSFFFFHKSNTSRAFVC